MADSQPAETGTDVVVHLTTSIGTRRVTVDLTVDDEELHNMGIAEYSRMVDIAIDVTSKLLQRIELAF